MQNELIDFLTNIERCNNQKDVWELLTQTSHQLGFNISIFAKPPKIKNNPPVCKHNYLNGWKDYYAEQQYYKYDAFYLHTFNSSLPTTLDVDKKQSHLIWEETGKNLLNEIPEAGLKRALFVPILNDQGNVSGSITFGTELMSSTDFEHLLSSKFPILYGIATSAYNKLTTIDNSLKNNQQLRLTPRQYDILQALALGQTNKQIAYELDIKVVTVSHHLKELQKSLNVGVNRQILPKAYSLGLLKND